MSFRGGNSMASPSGQLAAHRPHCMQPSGGLPSPALPSFSSSSTPSRLSTVPIAFLRTHDVATKNRIWLCPLFVYCNECAKLSMLNGGNHKMLLAMTLRRAAKVPWPALLVNAEFRRDAARNREIGLGRCSTDAA